MRSVALLLVLLCTFTSCKSTKRVRTNKEIVVTKKEFTTADRVVEHARTYNGVRYKYGGASKRGMDCSGLVTTAFGSAEITLPRTTKALSVSGDWIDLKEVKKGDLLFFATKKNSRTINHVGIVTHISDNQVEFIHSTTSKGVITSKLSERYWYFAFVQARRVL